MASGLTSAPFLRALFGRAVATGHEPDPVEAEAMIAELSAQLPPAAAQALRSDVASGRALRGRERAAWLAAWFNRAEDALAAGVQDPQAFRADFRSEAARRWPKLAALSELKIAFSQQSELEGTLCRFFLREATQRARDLLGVAGGGKLVELTLWLEAGLGLGAPSPFAAAGAPPATGVVGVSTACSHAFYAWLENSLGRRADTIYESAYQQTARQYGAADAFHVVIGLLPDKLITADKLGLLRRGQIEQVLREKITLLEQANVDTERARKQAEATLGELKAAQQNLIHAEKMASLGQLTAGVAHEIKNPLNFVNNFAKLSIELLDELKSASAQSLSADVDAREEVNSIIETLASNLEKIARHGARADAIVKSMLAHSRSSDATHEVVDLNAIVEESLNLAYHGARAEKPTFHVRLVRDFAPDVGMVALYPAEFTRVLLNLISNGFYAAATRKLETKDTSFEPILTASTRAVGDHVEIAIRDNGIGVSEDVRAKMFNPFFTTKPPGEGTGLGLSLSYDIVVRQHGGSISVVSAPGEYTELTIRIPRDRS